MLQHVENEREILILLGSGEINKQHEIDDIHVIINVELRNKMVYTSTPFSPMVLSQEGVTQKN